MKQSDTFFSKYAIGVLLPIFLFIAFTGCEVVEGIFNAGFILGTIVTIAIVVFLIWGIIKIIKSLK